MTKSIFKEIIIILLLILAIILVLGILLYEYVPSNKIIPEHISYTTPESVKTELETGTNFENDEVVLKYSIDSTDLQNYKRVNEYVAGKNNPFASLKKDAITEENNGGNENTNSVQNTETPSSTEQNQQQNSTSYVPDKGTK